MRIFPISTLVLILLFTGCGSNNSITSKYYIISLQDDKAATVDKGFETIEGSCEIEPVGIHPVYERILIVNRSDSHELTYYKHHQWAVRPAVNILEFIENYLGNNHIFESVSTRYSRSIPEYRFATYVHALEVIENKDSFSAHLHIEFMILDNSSDQVLLNHLSERTEALPVKDLNLFAQSISNMLLSELEHFTEKIGEQRSRLNVQVDK
jgi:ABC-type uncharacterized transport system auxiliary subunit